MQKFSKLLVALLLCCTAEAAVPVNDDGSTLGSSSYRRRYDGGMEMRRSRRVGIGLGAAGALGTAGVNLELNFTNEDGLILGYGVGSPNFQSFLVEYKKVLAGDWLLPYFSVGFAHWGNYGEQSRITKTTPDLLGDKLLSNSDKRSGIINENIIFPGFGLQFVKLSGAFAGSSIYMEVLALVDVEDFVAAPTGSVGYLYYF